MGVVLQFVTTTARFTYNLLQESADFTYNLLQKCLCLYIYAIYILSALWVNRLSIAGFPRNCLTLTIIS